MKLNRFLTLTFLIVASGMYGCAKKAEEQPQTNSDAPSTSIVKPVSARINSSSKAASSNSQFNLTGVWVGTSGLDQQALQEKLAKLEGAEAQQLLTRARIFDSIFMAYQFNADQTMEIDMEIVLPNQEKIQEQAFGRWKVTPGENNSIIVTTIENRENGAPEQTTKQFFIVSENEFQIVPTNIAEELVDLKPFYLFQRQSLESIPLSAEVQGNKVLK